MSASSKRLILDNDADAHGEGEWMEFYLTYQGPLNATQRDPIQGQAPRHSKNRRDLRRSFHVQMKKLWAALPALNGNNGRPEFITTRGNECPSTIDELASAHAMYGYNFVPLVTEQLDLLCSIDVLMLRPDKPGSVIWAGDIDNRLKTLLDALRIPEAGERYGDAPPTADEQPFFVLLQDDKLITRVAVETDRLLQEVQTPPRDDDVRLFIKVSIRPYALHADNMHFG